MILHHLQNSRLERIIWLLEELQLAYEIEFYSLETAQQNQLKFSIIEIKN